MITVHETIQGSPEWHKLREGKYTGSNAHKLLRYGATKFAITSDTGFKGNFYTKRGHILEDEAIELYEKIRHTAVDRPGFITNDDFPDCGYSPDAAATVLIVEVKCFNTDKHLQIYNGYIPLEIMAQVHFGMLICDRPMAHLVIYNPDLDAKLAFKIIPIVANRKILENFKRILKGAANGKPEPASTAKA